MSEKETISDTLPDLEDVCRVAWNAEYPTWLWDDPPPVGHPAFYIQRENRQELRRYMQTALAFIRSRQKGE